MTFDLPCNMGDTIVVASHSTEVRPSFSPERERFIEECDSSPLPPNERPVPAPLCFATHEKKITPDRARGMLKDRPVRLLCELYLSQSKTNVISLNLRPLSVEQVFESDLIVRAYRRGSSSI